MPCFEKNFFESRFAYEFKRDLSYFSRFVDAKTHRADFINRAVDLGRSLFGMCPSVDEGQNAAVVVAASDADTLGLGFVRGLSAQAVNVKLHSWDVDGHATINGQDTDYVYFPVPSLANLDIAAFWHIIAAKSPHTRVLIAALTISDDEIDDVLNRFVGHIKKSDMANKWVADNKPLFVGHDWDNSIETGAGMDFEINRPRLAELFQFGRK